MLEVVSILSNGCYLVKGARGYALATDLSEVPCNQAQCGFFDLSVNIYQQLLELMGGKTFYFAKDGKMIVPHQTEECEKTESSLLTETVFDEAVVAEKAGLCLMALASERITIERETPDEVVVKVGDFYLHGLREGNAPGLCQIEISIALDEVYCAESLCEDLNIEIADYLQLAQKQGADIWVEEEQIAPDFIKKLTQVVFDSLPKALGCVCFLM